MIELMSDFPDNVVALSVTGKVSGDDYENILIPAIESALKAHDKARLLYYCGPDYESFSAEAAWDDTKVGMHHLTHFEKIAVVTDDKLITAGVKLFGFAMPGKVKLFGNEQLADAKSWIVE